jgi:hypothetical protein
MRVAAARTDADASCTMRFGAPSGRHPRRRRRRERHAADARIALRNGSFAAFSSAHRSRSSAHSGLCDAKSGPFRRSSNAALSSAFIRLGERVVERLGAGVRAARRDVAWNKTSEKKMFRFAAPDACGARASADAQCARTSRRRARCACMACRAIFFAPGC